VIRFSESNSSNRSPAIMRHNQNNFGTHNKDQICSFTYLITTKRKRIGNLRFSQWCCCRFKSYETLLCVDWYIVTDVSESRSALIFRVKNLDRLTLMIKADGPYVCREIISDILNALQSFKSR
jgi:hypothetical protein